MSFTNFPQSVCTNSYIFRNICIDRIFVLFIKWIIKLDLNVFKAQSVAGIVAEVEDHETAIAWYRQISVCDLCPEVHRCTKYRPKFQINIYKDFNPSKQNESLTKFDDFSVCTLPLCIFQFHLELSSQQISWDV